MVSELAARRASPADADRITAVITAAFAHDPLWERAMARPDGGTAHHAALWRLYVEGALRYQSTWLTGDSDAVAVWIPPGGTDMTSEQEHRLADLAARHLGSAADDYLELLSMFHAAHPRSEPHYFLTLLATDPAYRGQGLGMRLLTHGLQLIDAEHQPAYLESSNPANDHRYVSAGFEPHGEFRFPGGGPVVTTMWRPAR